MTANDSKQTGSDPYKTIRLTRKTIHRLTIYGSVVGLGHSELIEALLDRAGCPPLEKLLEIGENREE